MRLRRLGSRYRPGAAPRDLTGWNEKDYHGGNYGIQILDPTTRKARTPTGNYTDGSGYNWNYYKFLADDEVMIGKLGIDATYGAQIEYLVVAGGGGGGSHAGGGGGGFLTGTLAVRAFERLVIKVGAGGTGATASHTPGSSGSDSKLGSITAHGGGGGGGGYPATASGAGGPPFGGGSGGGGNGKYQVSGDPPNSITFGATGVAGQGNRGGHGNSATGNPDDIAGGGGGGANAVGGDASSTGGTPGTGGEGITSSITGVGLVYGSGGGGEVAKTGGVGGAGGTNAGRGFGGSTGNATSGVANYGGGGGGGSSISSQANGGSGVVIFRVRMS